MTFSPTIKLAAAMAAITLTGCSGRPTLFPNPDMSLRKTSAEFSADAAKRFPYPAAEPHVPEPKARAQAAYMLNRLEVVNFSGQEWTGVEVWVNRKYVCYLPKMEDRQLKEVHFPMLFNDRGEAFPMDNLKERVQTVELRRDGKVYELYSEVADY